MKQKTKMVKEMLKSIDQISNDISNDLRTKEITEKLKANKKRCTDILADSYSEAFTIQGE